MKINIKMPRTKVLTPEEKKQIAILKSQQQLFDDAINDSISKGKTQSIKLMEQAKKENEEKIKKIDETYVPKETSSVAEIYETESVKKPSNDKSVFDAISDMMQSEKVEVKQSDNDVSEEEFKVNNSDIVPDTDAIFDIDDRGLQYDVIPLPSKGQCYPNKVNKLAVAYLTAESENLITSPHLYQDDMVIDALLRYHVLNKGFNTDNLVQGDIDAIMLWLRSTGYGPEFPIEVNDPEINEKYQSVVDLTTIKVKDFGLKGDADGFFDFTLPVTKKKIKFKYLSRKEDKLLKRLNQMETNSVRATLVKTAYETMAEALKYERSMTSEERIAIEKSLVTIKNWTNKNKQKDGLNHLITNRMEMMIQEVDGNRDKTFIHNLITNLPALDCLKLRRYMTDNEPGVDWNVTVTRPESLGGGPFSLFLEWDSNAFFNVV